MGVFYAFYVKTKYFVYVNVVIDEYLDKETHICTLAQVAKKCITQTAFL